LLEYRRINQMLNELKSNDQTGQLSNITQKIEALILKRNQFAVLLNGTKMDYSQSLNPPKKNFSLLEMLHLLIGSWNTTVLKSDVKHVCAKFGSSLPTSIAEKIAAKYSNYGVHRIVHVGGVSKDVIQKYAKEEVIPGLVSPFLREIKYLFKEVIKSTLDNFFTEFDKFEWQLAGLPALKQCMIFTSDSSKLGLVASVQSHIERATTKLLEDGVSKIQSIGISIDSRESIQDDLEQFFTMKFTMLFYNETSKELETLFSYFVQTQFVNGLNLYMNKLIDSHPELL